MRERATLSTHRFEISPGELNKPIRPRRLPVSSIPIYLSIDISEHLLRQHRLAGVYAAGGELLHRLQGPAGGGTDPVNWIKRYGLSYARVISLELLTC